MADSILERSRFVRSLAHLWALPVTLFGLLVALIAWTKPAGWWAGPYKAHYFIAKSGGLGAWLAGSRWAGWTCGTVIIFAGERHLANSTTVRHENVHVRFFLTWGPLAPVLYLCASLVAKAAGQDLYRGNDFEEQAYDEERE